MKYRSPVYSMVYSLKKDDEESPANPYGRTYKLFVVGHMYVGLVGYFLFSVIYTNTCQFILYVYACLTTPLQ